MATSATAPNGRVLRAAAVVLPIGRDGLVPPSLIAYRRGILQQTSQLRSVYSTAAGERMPLLSTSRPRLSVPPQPGGDASLLTAAATAVDRSASCSSLSDPTVNFDDDSEITSTSGDLVDEPLGGPEDERRAPAGLRRGFSGDSSIGGGQSSRRRRRGNLKRVAYQSKPAAGSGSTSALPIGQSAESNVQNNDAWTPIPDANDYVSLPKFEFHQRHGKTSRQPPRQTKTTTNTTSVSSISFPSYTATSESPRVPPEVNVFRQPSSPSVSVGVVAASPYSTVVKRQSSGGGGGGDIDSLSDAVSGGTTECRRHDKMSSLRGLAQSKIYNFLERPTGWKCFAYHFSV